MVVASTLQSHENRILFKSIAALLTEIVETIHSGMIVKNAGRFPRHEKKLKLLFQILRKVENFIDTLCTTTPRANVEIEQRFSTKILPVRAFQMKVSIK
jgi:predicted transcriptional regulator